jgi:glycosyltransferase involved in cell wall biosynthesis
MKKVLTVAIVCKNEEKQISACIESVIEACKFLPRKAYEIILVDSYSTDSTVDIALNYDITIYRLGKDWFHSPAAGRFTAVNHASGEFLFIIDADMTLHEGFLQNALEFIRTNPRIGGVRGIMIDIIPYGEEKIVRKYGIDNVKGCDASKPQPIKVISGAGLFRLDAIKEAGNFHPFLGAEEEYDICQRLRRKGYQLWNIPFEAVTHHGRSSAYWEEISRRIKGPLYIGMGTKLANSLKHGFFLEDFKRYTRYIIYVVPTLLLPLALLVSIATGNPLWIIANLFLEFLLFGASMLKKGGNVRKGFRTFITLNIIGISIFRGFIKGIPPANRYPTNVEIVKTSKPDR